MGMGWMIIAIEGGGFLKNGGYYVRGGGRSMQ